jgi:hypothetical protein
MRIPPSVFFYVFLLSGFSLSCATRPHLENSYGETGPLEIPAADSPRPSSLPVDELIRRVKNNDPGLEKYFLQDEQGTITVKAEADGFEILYDLAKARPVGAARWEVDFSVYQADSGESRQDTLLWNLPHDGAGILLSLDDSYEAQWRRFFDLFDYYGVKLTFFVIGDRSPFVPRP